MTATTDHCSANNPSPPHEDCQFPPGHDVPGGPAWNTHLHSWQHAEVSHEVADRTARRRLRQALDDLTAHAQTLRRLLDDTEVELSLSDSDRFTDAAARVTRNLAVIETLRDVRGWYADNEGGTR